MITVTVPTYNSEKTLRATLESIKCSTYKDVEIIVVDSYSTDDTIKIAKDYADKICKYSGTLLGARGIGIEKAKGDYILLLDSDQILEKTALDRALVLFEAGNDMLWLYERSYYPKKLLEKLYDADRELTQKYVEDFIKPVGGTILPRFYKANLLKKAFKNIPKKILPLCVAHDHAIIYYEVNKLSNKIAMLERAVFHREPWSWSNLFKKTYRYGITTRKLIENDAYPELIKSKNKFRKMKYGDISLSIKSNILRVARGIPYKLGYYFGGK